MLISEFKIRMIKLGKRNVDLLEEVRKRGYPKLYQQQLSAYICRREFGPQAKAVLALIEDIITEWERQAKEERQ